MFFYYEILATVVVIIVTYTLFTRVRKLFARRAFMSARDCKPPRCRVPLRDPFFGIDFVLETIRNAKNGCYLEGTNRRFHLYGQTFVAKHLHYPTIHTTDPANIKQILATAFHDFKLSSFRIIAMVPLFGKGIFTTDGDLWKHSRSVLRPSFDRHNMASHLPLMESHFEYFMKALPHDGSVVDLQKLFFAFTMDTATAFLFGHSVHTLASLSIDETSKPKTEDTADKNFVDSYT